MGCSFVLWGDISNGFGGRFGQADIHEVAHDMLTALMDKIASGGSPEKVSENDYLMKCVCGCVGGGAVG